MSARRGQPRARAEKTGFPPVVSARARVLILGSFPGEASLAAGHYYAHPRNLFWPILADLFGEPLAALPFEQRYAIVVERGLAIWDVLSACSREGSLDSAIRDATPNDFSMLRGLAPALELVIFNGQLAGRHAGVFRERGYDALVLPSTSPAYAAMPAAAKAQAWARALAPYLRD